jgi:8-oxo-dGTP pyrophosphatase MutT (NUDIX family)
MNKNPYRDKDDTDKIAGTIVFDICENLLVVKQRCGTWSLPKGAVKINECPLTGALRETNEEAGIDLSALIPIKHISIYSNVFYLYKLPYKGDQQPLVTKPDSIAQDWISLIDSEWFRLNVHNRHLRKMYKDIEKYKKKFTLQSF